MSQNKFIKIVENGEYIRDAIEKYRNDNGEYPTSISTLIGNYLDEERLKITDESSWEYPNFYRHYSWFYYINKYWYYNLDISKLEKSSEYEIILDLSRIKGFFMIHQEDPYKHEIQYKSSGIYDERVSKWGETKVLEYYKNWAYIITWKPFPRSVTGGYANEPDWKKMYRKFVNK